LQNAGGTLILEWGWYKNLNDQPKYGLSFAPQTVAEMFPDQGFAPGYQTMQGYPIYLVPNESVYLKFSANDGWVGTGTAIDVQLRFWDLKDGVHRVQSIRGNIVIGRMDMGPAIAEK